MIIIIGKIKETANDIKRRFVEINGLKLSIEIILPTRILD